MPERDGTMRRERRERLDRKSNQRKQARQPMADQVRGSGQDMTGLTSEPSLARHAALLAEAHSDEQRARVVIQLQRYYGNAYVQRIVERIREETGSRQTPEHAAGPASLPALQRQATETAPTTKTEQKATISVREMWQGGVVDGIRAAYAALKKDPTNIDSGIHMLQICMPWVERVRDAYGPAGRTGKTEPTYWLVNSFHSYMRAQEEDLIAHAVARVTPFEKVRDRINPDSKEMKAQIDAIGKAI